MNEDYFLELKSALKAQGLTLESVAQTFNLIQGKGILARKANIDPAPFLAELSADRERRNREVQAYARGVKHVLLEPTRSDAHTWSFVESAGSILPILEVASFGLGARAAADEAPFALPFQDDLRIFYLMRLSRGLRVLTATQVDAWEIAQDRLTAAARSLLFHRTRDLKFRLFEDFSVVHRLHAGDGHDAARYQVVPDAFYTEVGSDFRFSMPTPEHFLATFSRSDTAFEELKKATAEVYAHSDAPLSPRVYRFDGSKPLAVS